MEKTVSTIQGPGRAGARLRGFIDLFLPADTELPPGSVRRMRMAVVGSLIFLAIAAIVAPLLYLGEGVSMNLLLTCLTVVLVLIEMSLIRYLKWDTFPGSFLCLWMQAMLVL